MNSRIIPISQGDQRAWVYPEHGFQLYGYEHKINGKNIPVIHVPGLEREPLDRRYGNPILFPAPSVTHSSHGRESWVCEDKVLPMPAHGFARNCYWHVVDVKSSSVTAELIPNSSALICFPFEFRLRMTYHFAGSGLILDAELENTGQHPFPYSLGFHPYINAPLGKNGKKSDCTVALPKSTRLSSKDGWNSFQNQPDYGPITIHADGPELATTIMLADSGAKFLELNDVGNQMKVRVSAEGSEQSLPVWAVWSGSPDAPYICLEPWSDAPNALNRKETRQCRPGEKHFYQMVISVSQ